MSNNVVIYFWELPQLVAQFELAIAQLEEHVRKIPADVRMPNAHISMYALESADNDVAAKLVLVNPDDPAHAHMMPPEGALELITRVSDNDCATALEVLEALHSKELHALLSDHVTIGRLLADARSRAQQPPHTGAAA
ncbi:hypothetical protein GOL26_28730 [Sinorhizobium medicae]|nr:hypothetical protein [Sinorhizobium medicae]MDX0998859.1 hypothetical protein [Sinorhizobium medicae]MDX1182804.1 hypothetical protein [Sinorhizobium medicae]